MLKSISLFFVLLSFADFASTQTLPLPTTQAGSTADLEFSVMPGKTAYLPLEPIVLTFKLRNPTDKSFVRKEQVYFFPNSKLDIRNHGGKLFRVSTLSLGISQPQYTPWTKFELKPDESVGQTGFAAIDPSLLAQPGEYSFTVTYQWKLPPYETLTSPSFKITIVEPSGRDKNACEFLTRNGGDVFFNALQTPKNRDEVLKMFVQQYGGTGYGEYGIFALSSYYLYDKSDESRAYAELKKLLSSKNAYLAEQAAERLRELK